MAVVLTRGTRPARALKLETMLKRGPEGMPDAVTQEYREWAAKWILPELARLVPELADNDKETA